MKSLSRYRQVQRAGAYLLVAVLGCSRRDPGGTAFDFAASFPQAELRFETHRLDFGSPAARAVLISGWSVDEQWEGGDTTFVWGTGAASTLRFFRLSPRAPRLRFRCRPLHWPGAPPQVVTVFVNGARVADVRLPAAEFAVHEVLLPAAALRNGENRLDFHYSRLTRPPAGEDGAGDPRALSVAWDWLTLLDTDATPATSEPAARAAAGSVLLPFAARLDYFLPIAPGSRLRFQAIRSWGVGEAPDGAGLEVQIETAGPRPVVRSFTLDLTRSRREVDLEGIASDMARVSFIAHPGREIRGDTDGLALVQPILLVRQQRQPGPSSHRSPSPLAPTPPSPPAPRPNILLYVVDTLRADHLGTYGYPRPVSPHLDAFAAEGVVFTQAYAQSGWTRTSVTSILTGLSPLAHRVLQRADGLPAALPTLQSTLREAGYETVGVMTNPTVAAEFGFARGFDHFVSLDREQTAAGLPARAERVNEEFLAWLKTRRKQAPFFAYLHTMDPHDPYTPPEPYRSRFASHLSTDLNTPRHDAMVAALASHPGLTEEDLKPDLIGLYDGEIAANDEQFGRLLAELRRAGLYANTLVVFVSDHGEEFRDHGFWGHGHSLYREILQVPLVVKPPGSALPGRRIDRVVQQVDLMPTLLAAAGVAPPPSLSGESLLPVLSGNGARAPDRPVLSYLRVDAYDLISLVSAGRHLLSRSPQQPEGDLELYDLQSDPLEHREVGAREPLWAGHLLGLLRAERAALRREVDAPQVRIDQETAERLKALGYVR